jgi:hypothetical protein
MPMALMASSPEGPPTLIQRAHSVSGHFSIENVPDGSCLAVMNQKSRRTYR